MGKHIIQRSNLKCHLHRKIIKKAVMFHVTGYTHSIFNDNFFQIISQLYLQAYKRMRVSDITIKKNTFIVFNRFQKLEIRFIKLLYVFSSSLLFLDNASRYNFKHDLHPKPYKVFGKLRYLYGKFILVFGKLSLR